MRISGVVVWVSVMVSKGGWFRSGFGVRGLWLDLGWTRVPGYSLFRSRWRCGRFMVCVAIRW